MSQHLSWVEECLDLTDPAERHNYLAAQFRAIPVIEVDEVRQALKEACIRALWVSARQADACAELARHWAQLTRQPHDQALGLRLKAMVLALGYGRFEDALVLYDQAIDMYRVLDDALGQALVHLSRIWAVARLGRYEQAVAEGVWAAQVFESCGRERDLATLHNNLALVHLHFGRFSEALAALGAARQAFLALGEAGAPFLTNNESNHVFVFYVLGRFKDAIAAGERALALAKRFQQTALLARVQQNCGLGYYGLGQYGRALQLFDQAKESWLAEQRYQELIQVELTATYCLLQLRRWPEVLTRCAQARQWMAQYQVLPETAFSLLNEARAYGELGQYDEALRVLAETRRLIEQFGGSPWDLAEADLVEALLYYWQGNYSASQSRALACVTSFEQLQSPPETAIAYVLAARAAGARRAHPAAQTLARQALSIADQGDIAAVRFEANFILGQLAQTQGEVAQALDYYQIAMTALERWQQFVMVEHRADFLLDADKTRLYEALVELHLAAGRATAALECVERAKSRALLDLIGHHVDVRVRARTPEDQPLIDELNRLRAELNQLARQADQPLLPTSVGRLERLNYQRALEERLTQLRQQLLVRNAAYALEPTLAQAVWLAPGVTAGTVLLEYFVLQGKLVVFVVSAETPDQPSCVQAYALPATVRDIQRLSAAWQLNLQMAGRGQPAQIARLIPNAQGILRQLYQHLLAPVAAHLQNCRQVIVVPHGLLHDIPFHALHDGDGYIIERLTVTYLPAAALLTRPQLAQPGGSGMLALGYSWEGRLPHAAAEARTVASGWSPHCVLSEEGATLADFLALAPDFRVLHLATHGEFRADNPLFCGLALADGWLTTFDLFNLTLNASLVTLSACDTGRSVVGGGDELLGLTRAFLAAGAPSLLLSHWPLADRSAAQLLAFFYARLADGAAKGDALRASQCDWLRSEPSVRVEGWEACQAHPFFWASLFLVGDSGPI